MNYKEAEKALRKIGCAHAEGDAKRAMWSKLVSDAHGGKPEKYFDWYLTIPDNRLLDAVRFLAGNRQAAWDILIQIPVELPLDAHAITK